MKAPCSSGNFTNFRHSVQGVGKIVLRKMHWNARGIWKQVIGTDLTVAYLLHMHKLTWNKNHISTYNDVVKYKSLLQEQLCMQFQQSIQLCIWINMYYENTNCVCWKTFALYCVIHVFAARVSQKFVSVRMEASAKVPSVIFWLLILCSMCFLQWQPEKSHPWYCISSMIMHQRQPKKHFFLQEANSLCLSVGGLSQNVKKRHRISWSLGPKGTVAVVDSVRQEFGKQLEDWKTSREVQLDNHLHTISTNH